MKKKFLFGIGAVVIAATLVFNTGIGNNAKMSAITLANIEALTKIEDPGAVITCDSQCFTGASCYEKKDGCCEWTGNMANICYGPCC